MNHLNVLIALVHYFFESLNARNFLNGKMV